MSTAKPAGSEAEPKDLRFVAIQGSLYEVDDIIAALHGREFLATLDQFDLRDMGNARYHAAARKIVRESKTKALKKLVADSTDGLKDNLPNRDAILMALDKSGGLGYNSMTKFMAQFAQLTSKDASHVKAAVAEVRGKGNRVFDSSSPLGGPSSEIMPYSLRSASRQDILGVLHDGKKELPWNHVTTVMIERAILGQGFSPDEWLQMSAGDSSRQKRIASGYPTDLRTRLTDVTTRAYVAGAIGSAVLIFPAALTGIPELVILPLSAIAFTLSSAAATIAGNKMPSEWLTSMADTANRIVVRGATALGAAGVTRSTGQRRLGEVQGEYEELFEMTKTRVAELRATGTGRLGLLLIREIIGQAGKSLSKDQSILERLQKWVSHLRKNPGIAQTFNKFCESRALTDLDSIDTAIPLLKDFNLYLRSSAQTDKELAEEARGNPLHQKVVGD